MMAKITLYMTNVLRGKALGSASTFTFKQDYLQQILKIRQTAIITYMQNVFD
jgi:hypothetical protein